MRKIKIVLTAWALVPILVFAESDYEAVVDDSVIGYWRFNDPNDYGKDASGHGSHITEWAEGATGETVTVSTDASGSRGGGCLYLPRNGTKSSNYKYGSAVATVTSGKSLDMSRTEGGWTVATWVQGSEDLATALGSSSALENDDTKKFRKALSGGWHPLVIVFRPGSSKDYYHVYVDAFDGAQVADVTSGGTDSKGNPAWHIPLTVSNGKVTLGGDIGGSVKVLWTIDINTHFFGRLDDCVILDRELYGGWFSEGAPFEEHEVRRFVKTGETFVYSTGSSGYMFYEAGKWSNGEAPKAGLAYIVENGREVKANMSAIFAGKSLSVGRTEKLYGITNATTTVRSVVVDNTIGMLTQMGDGTELTVDDLVLNDGFLTSRAKNQKLTANIRVRASAANPFKIATSNGTYQVFGTMRGNGSIVKTGPATLDLSGLTESTAKVSLSEGSLRLAAVNPTLFGYDGGTLLVDFDENAGTATTVTIDSLWAGALAFKLNGTPSKVGRYAAIRIPTSVKSVTAADFDNQTVCASGMTARIVIVTDGSNQTVLVECIPTADQGDVPVMIFE